MTSFTHNDLNQFTGDLERYRHAINRRVLYTPGVRFVAERGGAYWLIDEIAIALGSKILRQAADHDPRIADLHFWKLEVQSDRSARLLARVDSGERPFISRKISFTDFPLAYIDIWAGYDGTHWTLYLPSEH